MMKKTFHGSAAQLRDLTGFILDRVVGSRTSFEVSDVKRDGTVFVRFRSGQGHSATYLIDNFVIALNRHAVAHALPDENKVRLSLKAFAAREV